MRLVLDLSCNLSLDSFGNPAPAIFDPAKDSEIRPAP